MFRFLKCCKADLDAIRQNLSDRFMTDIHKLYQATIEASKSASETAAATAVISTSNYCLSGPSDASI